MRQGHNPDQLPVPRPAYSQVVVSGDLVFTSGQVGRDATYTFAQGVEAQTRKALENIRTCLAEVGCSMDDVMKVSTFLGRNEFFETYDRVYREFFDKPYPARTTVATIFEDETLIEIDVMARTPSQRDGG
jgi:enamine deaminase RidA (YjgF/YER057c/UK114 family)